jgi:serine protease Do
LQDIEDHVQQIVAKVAPATVCVRVGNLQGSGVIVDRDGRILTAAHVSGEAGREATVILADGRRVRGKTLGANKTADSGMVLITENASFIYMPMAKPADLKRGQWCVALGHPGGVKPNRPPVARLGRVQAFDAKIIVTDCAIVGGDSGGPLVDMKGRVIGIHSRIGGKVSANVHVPIDRFHDTWSRLAAGEVWGSPPTGVDTIRQPEPYFGVRPIEAKNSLKIEAVTAGSPAETAGLKVNDVIVRIDNRVIATVDEFKSFVKSTKPGAQVSVFVLRGGEVVITNVTIGRR